MNAVARKILAWMREHRQDRYGPAPEVEGVEGGTPLEQAQARREARVPQDPSMDEIAALNDELAPSMLEEIIEQSPHPFLPRRVRRVSRRPGIIFPEEC